MSKTEEVSLPSSALITFIAFWGVLVLATFGWKKFHTVKIIRIKFRINAYPSWGGRHRALCLHRSSGHSAWGDAWGLVLLKAYVADNVRKHKFPCVQVLAHICALQNGLKIQFWLLQKQKFVFWRRSLFSFLPFLSAKQHFLEHYSSEERQMWTKSCQV